MNHSLVGNGNNGGGYVCVGNRYMGKSLYTLLTFAVNLKLS